MNSRSGVVVGFLVFLGACTLDFVDPPVMEERLATASVTLTEVSDPADPMLVRRELTAWLDPGLHLSVPRTLRGHLLAAGDEALAPARIEGTRIIWTYQKTESVAGLEALSLEFPGLDAFPPLTVRLPGWNRDVSPIDEEDGHFLVEVSLGSTENLRFEGGSWRLSIDEVAAPSTTLLAIQGEGLPPAQIEIARDLVPAAATAELFSILSLAGIWSGESPGTGVLLQADLLLEERRPMNLTTARMHMGRR